MTSQVGLQVKIEWDATGVDAAAAKTTTAIARIGDAGRDASTGVEAAAAKTTAAITRIGDAGQNASTSVEAAAAKTTTAITRIGDAGRNASAGLTAPRDALMNVARQAPAAATASTASLGKIQMSAAQTAQALRQVPMQFTDIFTSLAAGQSPLQVFLQQGGQLKDSFGGAGAAARAMGGYVAGLITPMTVAAAAVAALGIAALQGANEQGALARALIVSGNAAATSGAQLQEMAAAIDASTRSTTGAATDALAQLVTTGKVSAEQLQGAATATLALQRAGILTTEEAVKAFAELGRAPVEAVLRLNDQYRFLTAATFAQISAAQKAGDTAGAAALAQQEFAGAMTERARAVEENLGLVELAWKGIADAAKAGWDAMLDVGRQDALEVQLAKARKALEESRGVWFEWDRKALQANVDRLQAQVDAQQKLAAETRKTADANAALVEYYKQVEKYQGSAAANASAVQAENRRYEAALAAARQLGNAAAIEDIERAHVRALAEINRDANEKAQQTAAAAYSVRATLARRSSEAELAELAAARARGESSEVEYQARMTQLRQQAVTAELAVLGEQVAKTLDPAQRAELLGKVQELVADWGKIEAEGMARIAAANKAAADEAVRAWNDYFGPLEAALVTAERELDVYGLNEAQIQRLAAARLQDGLAIVERRRQQLAAEDGTEAELAALQQSIEMMEYELRVRQRLAGAADAKRNLDTQVDMWKSIESTAHQTFVSIASGGKSAFDRLTDTLKNGLYDLLYQMTLKRWIIDISASVSGSSVSGSLASAVGLGGAPAGGQSSGGIGSWLSVGSSMNSAYTAAMGGFSPTYAAFATSSLGQSLGLSVAQSAGYMAPVYEGGALISAGTGGTAGGLTASGSSLGLGLSYAGAGLAGIAFGSMIARDKKVGGLDGTSSAAIGAVIGGALGGPIGALVGGIAGGVFNAAFGMGPKKYSDTRLSGEFGADGFSGRWATPWKQSGGWFRSDKRGTRYDALEAEQDQAFDSFLTGARAVFDGLIATTGDAQRSIEGWSFAVDRVVATEEAQAQLITDMANSLGQRLAPELLALQQEGESLADTAVRMQDEFALTSRIAALLGKDVASAFGQAGMASLSMRDALVQLMGGIEQTTMLTQAYYEGYFSAEERLANDRAALAAQFAGLNLAMPATRAEFRALVETMDLTTSAGQSMFAALMSMAGSFGSVADAAMASATELANAAKTAALADAAANATSSTDYALRVARANAIVPQFAAGGTFAGGLRLVGERGPELESTGPARIWSADQTRQLLSGGAGAGVVGELRALRADNAAQARSLAALQARMTRLLERWDGAGMPETRVA